MEARIQGHFYVNLHMLIFTCTETNLRFIFQSFVHAVEFGCPSGFGDSRNWRNKRRGFSCIFKTKWPTIWFAESASPNPIEFSLQAKDRQLTLFLAGGSS